MLYIETAHLQIKKMIPLQNKTNWVNLKNMKLFFFFAEAIF